MDKQRLLDDMFGKISKKEKTLMIKNLEEVMLGGLSQRELTAITMHYSGVTLKKIGKILPNRQRFRMNKPLGLSRERVRQIINAALVKLGSPSSRKLLLGEKIETINNDNPHEEIKDHLNKALPPLIARTEVGRLLPGVLNGRTLANLDSLGLGPRRFRFGKKIFYKKDDFIEWFCCKTIKE